MTYKTRGQEGGHKRAKRTARPPLWSEKFPRQRLGRRNALVDAALGEAKPGDVILCAGSGAVASLIQLATAPNPLKISHVMMVYRTGVSEGNDPIELAESTASCSEVDEETKQLTRGVQFHVCRQHLENYEGSVWLMPLKESLPAAKLEEMQSWIRDQHEHKIGYDYESIFRAALELALKLDLHRAPDFTTFFCSEFVCASLQIAGAIGYGINASECWPVTLTLLPMFGPPVPIKT